MLNIAQNTNVFFVCKSKKFYFDDRNDAHMVVYAIILCFCSSFIRNITLLQISSYIQSGYIPSDA